jgi:predicted ATPase
MLTSFQVENFKAFQAPPPIELAPITLLAGINSAGKSSLTQALLLLKQTLESGTSQALSPGRGPLLEQSLGDNFSDFVFGRPEPGEATLTYRLAFTYDKDHDTELFETLDALLPDLGTETSRQSLLSQVMVTFAWGPFGHRGRPTVRVADLQITVLIDPGTRQRPLVGLQIQPASSGVYKVIPIMDKTDSSLKDLAFEQLQIDSLSNFLPDFFLIYPSVQQPRSERDVPPSFARFFRGLFSSIRRDLSEHIYYLSSFRDPPERIYQGGQTAEGTLDSHGSNFPQVLWYSRDEKVRLVHPAVPSEKFPLSDMVTRVLNDVLLLKQRVQVQPVGEREDLLEVRVDTLGSEPIQVGLADVGLGYNQVLPIVIQGLLTPPGSLVIFEQPEIHLHFDVQAQLINFFIGLARAGRRVLVETHSSHMVDSLCLAIVKDRTNWLADNSQVLFVHPPDEHNSSASIEPVQTDRYGKILNYPPHFLPDIAALYEEAIREGFAKRREEKKERAE